MYTSVASLHIALDARIQQQNSNRKVAIFPEQYDIVLNDAIAAVLKSRVSAKINSKNEGYENSVASYDSLKSLKRTHRPITYFDNIDAKWYFELPSDYYMFDTLQSNIKFDRGATTNNTKTSTKYISIIKFNNIGNSKYDFKKDIITFVVGSTPTKTVSSPVVTINQTPITVGTKIVTDIINNGQNIITTIVETITTTVSGVNSSSAITTTITTPLGASTITPENINLVGNSNKSSFYYFMILKEYIKSKKDIDCYFENYLGEYYANSLIFVSNNINTVPTAITVKDSSNTSIVNVETKIIVTYTEESISITGNDKFTTVDMGSKKIDLISSMDDTNETTDFYQHYNRHLNPKCIMQEDRVVLTTDTTFTYNNLRLNYIKIPRPIDSRINQMTDIEITEDVLDVATKMLMSTLNLRDPYAEQEAQQESKQK